MKLSAIKLVTIIVPKKLKNELVNFFKSAGISGYTYYYVYGGGERQISGADLTEAENVKFRVLVPSLLAITLMNFVIEDYFGKEKVIAFEQDAHVIRYEKFNKVEYVEK